MKKLFLSPLMIVAFSIASTIPASALITGSNPYQFVQPAPSSGNFPVSVQGTPTVNVNAAAASPVPVQESIGNAAVSNTNPLVVGSQSAADVSGTLAATGAGTQLNLQGVGCVLLTISGTWVATYQAQVSTDPTSSTFVAAKDVTGTQNATVNGARTFCYPNSGSIRVNVTAYTSGTLNYLIHPLPTTATSVGITGYGGNTVTSAGIGIGLAPASNFGLWTVSESLAYNGTNYDPIRKDTYAAAPIWITDGGATTAPTIASATTGPTIIKGSAGRLASIVIAVAGTTGAETFYNNATVCSGDILAVVNGTTATPTNTAGVVFKPGLVASAGITACGQTGSPSVTVGYY